MTQQTHTPGPWQIETDRPEARIDGGVYIMTPGQGICRLYDVTPDEWVKDRKVSIEANAVLLAASPALLEALKGLLGDGPDVTRRSFCRHCCRDYTGNLPADRLCPAKDCQGYIARAAIALATPDGKEEGS